jgi:hypothetical protein
VKGEWKRTGSSEAKERQDFGLCNIVAKYFYPSLHDNVIRKCGVFDDPKIRAN